MFQINCPRCGSEKVQQFPEPETHQAHHQPKNFPSPPMKDVMQYIVNYASLGISTVKMMRERRPVVYVVGAVAGGIVGCAVCFLNYAQELNTELSVKESLSPQTLYQCGQCGHHFSFAFHP